jgi:hypothetical protein
MPTYLRPSSQLSRYFPVKVSLDVRRETLVRINVAGVSCLLSLPFKILKMGLFRPVIAGIFCPFKIFPHDVTDKSFRIAI